VPSGDLANEIEGPTWHRFVLWPVLAFVFIMFPLLSHAGGLGFAPLAVIAGIGGYIVYGQKPDLKQIHFVFGALALFLVWAAISSAWSPYEDKQTLTNPVKLILGVLLYCGIFLLSRRVGAFARTILPHVLLAIGVITLGLLLIDQLSAYALTNLADPINEGEHPLRKKNSTYMNLSHSITVLALLTPLILTVLRKWGQRGIIYSGLWILTLLIAALIGRLAVGLVATIFSLIFIWFAKSSPGKALTVIIGLAIISLIFAPLMGYLMGFVPDATKEALPASWLHRVEMWAYTAEMVAQKPLFGHGFDASRTFDKTFEFRELGTSSIISLHPHNAGLHIWVETGIIGVILACVTLYALGQVLKGAILKSQEHAMAIIGFLAAALIICTLTYGVWQEWWWGILCLIGGFISLLLDEPKINIESAIV